MCPTFYIPVTWASDWEIVSHDIKREREKDRESGKIAARRINLKQKIFGTKFGSNL